ncbi:MAG TPA: hypothetical protein VKF42_01920 [Chitinivibrionales bacterium]|jgi:hypothetical protein|nr:hypothetical protein [Chitinivibrionales bacterium]
MKISTKLAVMILVEIACVCPLFAQPPVSADSFPNTGSTSWHAATFTVATDKAVYYPADSLAVQYTITNNANATQTYGPFDGDCEYDLIISLTDGTELYRQSTSAVCLTNLSYVTVAAGNSVFNDFAKFGYPPGVDGYVAALDSIVLTVSAQLWGTAYDSTKASTKITIKRTPTAVSAARPHPGVAGACFLSRGALAVSVPSPQRVTVMAFSADGRVFPQASICQQLPAGTHLLPLSCTGRAGIYIVRILGETFETTLKAVAGSGR